MQRLVCSALRRGRGRFPGREEAWYVAEKGQHARILRNAQAAGKDYGDELEGLAGRHRAPFRCLIPSARPRLCARRMQPGPADTAGCRG